MIVPGMFVCSSFLISVCMFIVSKALLISSATVIFRAGGAIWLNPSENGLQTDNNNFLPQFHVFLSKEYRLFNTNEVYPPYKYFSEI